MTKSTHRPSKRAAATRNRTRRKTREGAITAREGTATLREDAASAREDAATLREETGMTERRQAEEHLRAMAGMLDLAPSSITVHDLKGRFLYANRRTFEIHGYDEREFMSINLHELDVPASEALIAERMRLIAERGEATFEAVHFRKDGSTIPLEVSVKVVEWNRVPAVLSIATDITERERAERSIREAQEQFQAVFDSSVDGIGIAKDGIHVLVNRAHAAMFGYEPHEVIGKMASELVASDDRASTTAVDARVAGGMSQGPMEFRGLRKDGTTFPAEITIGHFAPHGEERAVGIIRDITERKRAEAEKVALEGQLQQARKMESVGRLAGGVAHEFNNMLGVILGYTEMALDRVDPAQPLHADLEEIHKAATRSADVTRHLLAFARQQIIAPRVLDLNDTVAGSLQMLGRLIGENIHLTWQPAAGLWPINVDPSQMGQILANLCLNGRDAISGTGHLTIETGNTTIDEAYCAAHPEGVPGQYVRLAVSDDGCGMDHETLARLFEPFFTTKEVGQGTGLGLATVHGIVKQNDGFVTVSSELGIGTTFRIHLPRHVAGAVEALSPAAVDPPNARGETILVAEDEPAVLELTTEMLQQQGYTVLAAGTPEEAIRLAREHAGEIHLLLTDVVMPAMNGQELVTRVVALRPTVRSLFMSGYTADVIAQRGVLVDDVQFIQKPFTRRDLATKVRQVLDSESA